MRVAAIYDIHGNLPALEAVLADIRSIGVDQIVVGGDIFPGPLGSECLDCVLDLDIPTQYIKGNGDRSVLELVTGQELTDVGERFRAVFDWNAERVTPTQAAAMSDWPLTVEVEVTELGRVLFSHATPHNDMDVFSEETSSEKLCPVFKGFDAQIFVCGHTHMQFDRVVDDTRIVNAGSVGSPYGESGAFWLLLGPEVQLKRTDYDLSAAGERIRASGYPQAEEFAAAIANPVPKAQILELLSGMELSF